MHYPVFHHSPAAPNLPLLFRGPHRTSTLVVSRSESVVDGCDEGMPLREEGDGWNEVYVVSSIAPSQQADAKETLTPHEKTRPCR
jgi:hypothetical protein